MIIIGEKINGAIPSIKQAIEDHNEELIRERVAAPVSYTHLTLPTTSRV
mgnify:CR=1 FL=1